MTQSFDFDEYLAALPRRVIDRLPADIPLPRMKSVGKLSDYNGFTGKERLRTFEIAKWLMKCGALKHSGQCAVCGGPGDQQHAEDYFDLASWMDICRGCHISLHGRFRTPTAWLNRLERLAVHDGHWARRLPPFLIDVAAAKRVRGWREPAFSDFLFRMEAT